MKEQMTVEMLRYQIAKYRVMGNGAMCQKKAQAVINEYGLVKYIKSENRSGFSLLFFYSTLLLPCCVP